MLHECSVLAVDAIILIIPLPGRNSYASIGSLKGLLKVLIFSDALTLSCALHQMLRAV